jgi:hypothetical protein
MKIIVIILVILAACSKRSMPTLPQVENQQLIEQINRVTPLLYWCDGQASGSGSNNVDHRLHCDVGDGAAESGFLTLVGAFDKEQEIFNSLKLSFNSEDRPFRAPSYVDKDTVNTFSRDQLLGFMQATVAGLPKEYLKKILDYNSKTGAMCPESQACLITPGLKIISKYILRENVTDIEKITEAAEVKIESITVPMNYRADLVMKRIFLMAKLDKLNTTHAKAAKLIYDRAPLNLWFKTVYGITNNQPKEFFNSIANSLTECLAQWTEPGTDWTFSKGNTECFNRPPGVYGHELIALAHLLLNIQPIKTIEDIDAKVTNFLTK